MNDTIRRYLVSSLTTFLTAFILTVAAQINAVGSVEFTVAFWLGIVMIAARAAVKAVVENLPALGRKIGAAFK